MRRNGINYAGSAPGSPALQLDSPELQHVAGTQMHGLIHLLGGMLPDGAQLALGIRWHTEGRGRKDEGVLDVAVPRPLGIVAAPVPFAVRLPPGPWTYHGRLVKILWEIWPEVRRSGGEPMRGPSISFTLLSPFAVRGAAAYR